MKMTSASHADVVGKHSVMLIGSPKDISSVFSVPVRRENRIYPCLYDEELQKIIAVHRYWYGKRKTGYGDDPTWCVGRDESD